MHAEQLVAVPVIAAVAEGGAAGDGPAPATNRAFNPDDQGPDFDPSEVKNKAGLSSLLGAAMGGGGGGMGGGGAGALGALMGGGGGSGGGAGAAMAGMLLQQLMSSVSSAVSLLAVHGS